MVDKTIAKIEAAIKGAHASGPAEKEELIRLLEDLKLELKSAKRKDALGSFEQRLGVQAAALEATHPQTAALVSEVCTLLASIGL